MSLLVGRADDLSRFSDASFDVVLSDAVLMYVGPDRIEETLRGMRRVARKGLVLVERESRGSARQDGMGVLRGTTWERNYIQLLGRLFPNGLIRVRRMNSDVWPDAVWAKHGAIIELRLEPSLCHS